MRIHTRLAWLSFTVTLIALGGATLLWNASLQRERRRDLDERLLDQARTLAALLPAPGSDTEPEMDRLTRVMHEMTGIRLTVIRADGVVLSESNLPQDEVEAMENHLHRPEVQEALHQGTGRSDRPSPTLQVPMAYLAVRWGPEEEPYGVVRAALPLVRVISEEHRGEGRLVLVLLGAVGIATLLGYVSARRVTRPVSRVSAAAREIAAGNLDRRVEPAGSSEVRELAIAINHLADSVETEINTVEAERRRLDHLLQNMPDGILALDTRGRITLANAAATAFCSLGPGAIGRTPVEVVRSPELQQAVDRTLASAEAETVELRLTEPERRVLSVSLVPMEGGLIVLFHDVTRLRRLETARREMVANIGHELRTPLTAILGYLETLEREPELSAGERARFLSVIARNARRLERLVRDLSRLSELESAGARVDLEPVAVPGLVSGVMETLEPRAADKRITLESTVEPGLPPVLADRHGLETVLLNLLDNAVRVSPEGETVSVQAGRRDRAVRFEIADRGPGVPRELRDRVFERFYRLDAGRSTEEGGSGLGLAIVKHAVLLYGGEVGVEERPGGGAVFFFTVPVTGEA
jgi:two-component system phosphate regulon sensor histidine kinase PhoR